MRKRNRKHTIYASTVAHAVGAHSAIADVNTVNASTWRPPATGQRPHHRPIPRMGRIHDPKWEAQLMKILIIATSAVLLALTGCTTTAPTASEQQQQLQQQKEECYRAHNQTMDKPAVKTMDACWRAHGQQMTK